LRKSGKIQSEEETAREYRKRLGVDHQCWLDPVTILTKLKHEPWGIYYETVPPIEIAPAPAKWDFEQKLILISNEIFDAANRQEPDGHARFSVFHEVVHALEGHTGRLNRLHSRVEIPPYAEKLRRLESRTDKITAAFIAPRHLISPEWKADDIAFRFGMSITSARFRIEEIRGKHRATRKVPDVVAKLLRDLDKS
jgi:Zn-dependent peptidase ImmA (M78 family)